jgi:hypothetical protein
MSDQDVLPIAIRAFPLSQIFSFCKNGPKAPSSERETSFGVPKTWPSIEPASGVELRDDLANSTFYWDPLRIA